MTSLAGEDFLGQLVRVMMTICEHSFTRKATRKPFDITMRAF